MPDDPLVIAKKPRAQAERARRLARGISHQQAFDALEQFARELDEEAAQLEAAIKAERSNPPAAC